MEDAYKREAEKEAAAAKAEAAKKSSYTAAQARKVRALRHHGGGSTRLLQPGNTTALRAANDPGFSFAQLCAWAALPDVRPALPPPELRVQYNVEDIVTLGY